jgi:hypothetical protein
MNTLKKMIVIPINWTPAVRLQKVSLFHFFKDLRWGKMGHPIIESLIKKFLIAEISKKRLVMIVKGYKL